MKEAASFLGLNKNGVRNHINKNKPCCGYRIAIKISSEKKVPIAQLVERGTVNAVFFVDVRVILGARLYIYSGLIRIK